MPQVQLDLTVQDYTLSARRNSGQISVVVEGDLVDQNGRPWRHVGPFVVTDRLTPEELVMLEGWSGRAIQFLEDLFLEQEGGTPPPLAGRVRESGDEAATARRSQRRK